MLCFQSRLIFRSSVFTYNLCYQCSHGGPSRGPVVNVISTCRYTRPDASPLSPLVCRWPSVRTLSELLIIGLRIQRSAVVSEATQVTGERTFTDGSGTL